VTNRIIAIVTYRRNGLCSTVSVLMQNPPVLKPDGNRHGAPATAPWRRSEGLDQDANSRHHAYRPSPQEQIVLEKMIMAGVVVASQSFVSRAPIQPALIRRRVCVVAGTSAYHWLLSFNPTHTGVAFCDLPSSGGC